jgi:meso-butanediol dehydrogenase/(S,S)-butanediol dehydrogenase/diacetyl reductase
MQRFAGRTAIVTASASGIGLAIARRFAAEGANVVMGDINEDGLREQAAALGVPLTQFMVQRCDVTVEDDVRALVDGAAERFGRVDILANNAGIGCWGYVTEVSYERWRRTFDVCVDSIFFTMRHALPHLIASGGAVVNIASISGLFGDYGFAAYNAAKGAVVNLTRNLAIDHAKDGVRVNAVAPGLIETPATRWMRENNAVMGDYLPRMPMGRPGRPEEIAAAVAFLASDDASYISGHCLVVDGALTAHTGQANFKRLVPERPASV